MRSFSLSIPKYYIFSFLLLNNISLTFFGRDCSPPRKLTRGLTDFVLNHCTVCTVVYFESDFGLAFSSKMFKIDKESRQKKTLSILLILCSLFCFCFFSLYVLTYIFM